MTNFKPNDFYKSLPAKRMAAGALLRDEQGRVLLVKPSYKESWEIPGGIVESNESPKQALIRELFEELGLELKPEDFRLVCIEYMSAGGEKTEALMFIFEYEGPYEHLAKALVPVDSKEILEMQFVELDKIADKVGRVLATRIEIAVNAGNGACIYSERAYEP